MSGYAQAFQRNARSAGGGYVRPVLVGLLILGAGLIPWLLLSRLNVRLRPDVPWAAIASLVYLSVLLAWLNGRGPPRATSEDRRKRLRLWPPAPNGGSATGSLAPGTVVALLVLLYGLWVVVGRLSGTPDLSAFPTTSYRWSMFLMGGFMSGVVEEAAYRGYMQTGLESRDPANAIVITSLVFAASHITHGLGALLLLGPGLFVASVLFGLLARRTGTILPGIVIHVVGDLAYTFFGALRGDASLLFV
jgi:membrane protease YdiL (CAAX protease family)